MSDDGYIQGAPELVAEIAASTATIDLREKKRAYRRNGVKKSQIIDKRSETLIPVICSLFPVPFLQNIFTQPKYDYYII